MPDIMLAEAGRLMLMTRRLLMPLWSLRRARRDVTLAQPANGRAGEDDDSDLDEASAVPSTVLSRRTVMMTIMLAISMG